MSCTAHRRSLHARLLKVLGSVIALCWIAALALMIGFGAHSQSSIWDEQMKIIAEKILHSMPDPGSAAMLNLAADDLRARPQAPVAAESMTFQVWIDRTRLYVRAPDAPAVPLRADFADGPASVVVRGVAMRVYSIASESGRVHVQVGEPEALLRSQVWQATLTALAIGTVLLVLLGGAMAAALRCSLKPLHAVSAALRARQKFDLAPLPVTAVPAELGPLVDSFNHLLGQLDQAVEAERRFIGDAAHELRTPLAALLAQAQIALRASSVEDKDAALGKLLAVAERSTRLSEQLLDLARLDAGKLAPKRIQTDLSALIVHVAREFDVVAQQRGRSIVLDTMACDILCDVDEVGILLRNLVDNALRYTGEGGKVRIRCSYRSAGADSVVLEVADDGPGVPDSERDAIFSRFHRVAGTASRGSGIGLSLVAGIARMHQASIETGPGLGPAGFAVRIVFPRPQAGLDTDARISASATSKLGIQAAQAITG